MKKRRSLKINNSEFGLCSLEPVLSESYRDFIPKEISSLPLNELHAFKVISSKHSLMGIIGLRKLNSSHAAIFHTLDTYSLNEDFQKNILEVTIDDAFSFGFCDKIFCNKSKNPQFSEEACKNCGFINVDGFFEITLDARNLFVLTNIIKIEAKNMLSNKDKLAEEVGGRVSNLWYAYFSKGSVNLSGGGVEKSIVSLKDLMTFSSLEGFNSYHHEEAPVISQSRIKKFLLEENVFRQEHIGDQFSATFSLGAHEGFMRISRCLYQPNKNSGMFFSMSCYGLFPTALSNMKPTKYDVVLINIDREAGEKISISDFKELIDTNPQTKSLCLELKTMCGAVYDDEEIAEIVTICKENDIFLIADCTHNNMEMSSNCAYPDVLSVCQKFDFHDVALIFTASKTYGLERARVGFILLDQKCNKISLKDLEDDLVCVLGTVNDVSKHVAHYLMDIPAIVRKAFVRDLQIIHKFNMNLMIAYIEGIESHNIDSDLKGEIEREIPVLYHGGITGVSMIYKPESGIHMKISVTGLQQFYYTNIRLFNSEIFSYVLNKIMGVVSLHAYCLADPKGNGVRLTFSRRNEVHRGMRLIHDFTKLLSNESSENPYMPGILVEDFIYNSTCFESEIENLTEMLIV